ncbi:MAG: hypothetical protein ACRDFT_01955 [bacterium]
MIDTRQQATDRNGRPIKPGDRVKVVGEQGQPEGTIVRVVPDYQVATVLLEQKGRVERMYPTADLDAVTGTPGSPAGVEENS